MKITQLFLQFLSFFFFNFINFQDLGLANGVATQSNSPIPLGAVAHQIYRTLTCRGLGDKDFSYVYEFLKNEQQSKQK